MSTAKRVLLPTIGLTQAKAALSEAFERALKDGPQEITRNGVDAVVVVSKQQWLKERGISPSPETPNERKRSAADFWLNSPLRGSGIKLEPVKGELQEVEF